MNLRDTTRKIISQPEEKSGYPVQVSNPLLSSENHSIRLTPLTGDFFAHLPRAHTCLVCPKGTNHGRCDLLGESGVPGTCARNGMALKGIK